MDQEQRKSEELQDSQYPTYMLFKENTTFPKNETYVHFPMGFYKENDVFEIPIFFHNTCSAWLRENGLKHVV